MPLSAVPRRFSKALANPSVTRVETNRVPALIKLVSQALAARGQQVARLRDQPVAGDRGQPGQVHEGAVAGLEGFQFGGGQLTPPGYRVVRHHRQDLRLGQVVGLGFREGVAALVGVVAASLIIPPFLSWYNEQGAINAGKQVETLCNLPELIRLAREGAQPQPARVEEQELGV